MNIFKNFLKRKKKKYYENYLEDILQDIPERYLDENYWYEYCKNCGANLRLQKGYNNDLPYWECKGCGEMLINNEAPDYISDIVWRCDKCNAYLNIQEQDGVRFSDDCGDWKCTDCGFENRIDESQIFASSEELEAELNNPYRGISDDEVLSLMNYQEISPLEGRDDIFLIEDEDGNPYVKKYIKTYNLEVYKYLMEHPIVNMPRIFELHEGLNDLVIIEEYVKGKTLSRLFKDTVLDSKSAAKIVREICLILSELHNCNPPIIHRDIKPSNVMITEDGKVILLDVNAAKQFKPDTSEDTRLLGTMYYAAPEQLGYGMTSSSVLADIYSVGVLLNVLITGEIPKEKPATGDVWEIIKRCTSLEPIDRYTDEELIQTLDNYLGN